MLKQLILASIVCIGSSTSFAYDDKDPVHTTPELDTKMYLGKWYQIAAIPAWFQKKCAKHSMADYCELPTYSR